jgi:hypothetical protein
VGTITMHVQIIQAPKVIETQECNKETDQWKSGTIKRGWRDTQAKPHSLDPKAG